MGRRPCNLYLCHYPCRRVIEDFRVIADFNVIGAARGLLGLFVPKGYKGCWPVLGTWPVGIRNQWLLQKDDFVATTPIVAVFSTLCASFTSRDLYRKKTGISLVTHLQHLCDSTVAPRHPFPGRIFRCCGGMSGGPGRISCIFSGSAAGLRPWPNVLGNPRP